MFSPYKKKKRSFVFARNLYPNAQDVISDITTMNSFLNDPLHPYHIVLHHLKESMQSVPHKEELIGALMQHAVNDWTHHRYITPTEKHGLYRTLVVCIFLADDKDCNVFKGGKHIPIKQVRNILRTVAYIPIYLDCTTRIELLLQLCEHYNAGHMESDWISAKKVALYANLVNWRVRIQEDYTTYTAEFLTLLRDLQSWKALKKKRRKKKEQDKEEEEEEKKKKQQHQQKKKQNEQEKAIQEVQETQKEQKVQEVQEVQKEQKVQKEQELQEVPKVQGEGGKEVEPEEPIPMPMLQQAFELAVQGLKYIGEWTSRVQEQVIYKSNNPISDSKYVTLTGNKNDPAKVYEQITRYNYENELKYAMVEIIGLIKGLTNLLLENESLIRPMLATYVHQQLQYFAHNTILFPLCRAHKRPHKSSLTDIFLKMRAVVADCYDVQTLQQDYKRINAYKNSKTTKSKKKIWSQMEQHKWTSRSVFPTRTQVLLLRRLVFHVCSEDSKGMSGGMFAKKDLKWNEKTAFDNVFAMLWFVSPLCDYARTLQAASNLSELWFREFYLNITDCIQFPIAMSLPWMLVDFAMNTKSLAPNVFFPLAVYNDSAETALSVFRQQHLFDEIEAEVNLVFDQLIFTLYHKIFDYYKNQAANMLLDKHWMYLEDLFLIQQQQPTTTTTTTTITTAAVDVTPSSPVVSITTNTTAPSFATPIHATSSNTTASTSIDSSSSGVAPSSRRYVFKPNYARYTPIFQQRSLHVLGRTVDIPSLLTEHLNKYIRENVDALISRLESTHSDITHVVEIDNLFQVLRLTVDLLREELPGIDVFEDIVNEVNEDTTLGSFRGRLFLRIFNQVFGTLLKNFVFQQYLQQFICLHPPKPSFKRMENAFLWGSRFTKLYHDLHKRTRGYFGIEHLHAIASLLGNESMPMLAHDTVKFIGLVIVGEISPYVTEILKALDPMKLQSAHYGVLGVYGYYDLRLKAVREYPALKNGVFTLLREAGNALCLLQLLDQVLTHQSFFQFQTRSFFSGHTSRLQSNTITTNTASTAALEAIDECKHNIDVNTTPSLLTWTDALMLKYTSPFTDVLRQTRDAVKNTPDATPEFEFLESCVRHSVFRTAHLRENGGWLLSAALDYLYKLLQETGLLEEWKGPEPKNGILEHENPKDFARFWSVATWIFLCPDFSPEEEQKQRENGYIPDR
ncbi:component of scar regulatory complex, partial [Reticulomyxa filosa]